MRAALFAVLSLSLVGPLLSACQAQALPTALSVEMGQTQAVLTQAALPTLTPSATERLRLPPTFTPTPSNTPVPTATTLPTRDEGRLYYLYNDDAIASVKPDGTDNTIAVTRGVGQAISEYVFAPDQTRIAFVAPGNGSGREIYLSDLSGTSIQKLTCLGYADVRSLAWTSDGTQLAFFAAPAAGSPGDIYLLQITTDTLCPDAQRQRILAPLQTSDFRGMTFNRPGTLLYYAGGGPAVYIWDLVTNSRYRATNDPPFNPDTVVRQNPVTDQWAFIRQSIRGSSRVGSIVIVQDSSIPPPEPIADLGEPYEALDLRWSGDGTLLLMPSADKITYFDVVDNRLVALPVSGLRLPEVAAASRDAIAYTAYDSKNVPQVFIYDLTAEAARQVTRNPDGTLRGLVWIKSP